VAIKSRGGRDARLGKVQDPAARQAIASLAYALNLVLVPGAVVAFGLVRARKRKLAARGKAGAAAEAAEGSGT